MTDKEMVGVRLPSDTLREVEQYAEEHDLSKSDALRRMVKNGVDLEKAGLTVAASQNEQTEETGKEPIADGGSLLRPVLKATTGLSLGIGGLLFFTIWIVGIMMRFPLPIDQMFGLMLSAFVTGTIFFLPTMTRYPERIDRRLWHFSSRVRQVFTT